jgi:hypothetical protein
MVKKSEKPTFDKQMDYEEVEGTDPIFSHAYHQFLVSLLTTRDKAVRSELLNDVVIMLKDSNDKVCKDIAEIVIAQNEKWGAVITEVMRGIDSVSKSVNVLKGQMLQLKIDNDKVHDELKEGLRKLTLRNNYWLILLRLVLTGVVVYFVVKYAHDHWWVAKTFLSKFG